jgi:hypothetical protein
MFNNRHDFKGSAGMPGASDGTLRAISLLKKNSDVLTDIISVLMESPNNRHDY